MALARSASGPGGLSINTGIANSIAPRTTQAPAAGSLFGSNTTTAQTSTTSGGLFGAASQPTTQPQQTTSLFGASTAANTQQKPAGGLFGNAAASTQKPATTSLFGNTTATATTQPAQPSTGGLFGGAAAATQTQKPSLFGSTMNQTQQPSSLFGGQQATAQPQAGSLFGNLGQQQQAQAAQPQGTSLFGQPQQTQGAGALGQSQANAQVVPGVQVDLSQIKGSTKFDDLTKEGQEFIAKVDAVIEQIGKWSNEIKSYTPVHEQELLQLSHDTGYLKKKYELVQRAVLQEDVQAIQELRTLSNQNIDDAQLAMRAVDNLKLPAHYHLPGLWAQSGTNTSFSGDPSEADLIGFFNRTSTHLQERDAKLRAYLAEIQQHMPNVEGGLYEKLTMLQRATGGGNEAFEQIRGTLEDMRAAIVSQAVQVGQTREALTKLQMGFFGQGGTA